jgi:hypothetical protein
MKAIRGLLIAVLIVGTTMTTLAQDEEPRPVTQGELAQLMVNVLGLSRFLPPTPTDAECVAILMVNGISPFEGWQNSEVVTRADLAKVVVEAMGRSSEVENPEDPASWIGFLESIDVPIMTVGQAADTVGPEGTMRSVEYGPSPGDLGYPAGQVPVTIEEVIIILERITRLPEEPEPVTPN